MKLKFLLVAVLFNVTNIFSQSDWKIAGNKITTPWASQVDPANPLPGYPRPQMVRKSWMNLNGLWQYVILPKSAVSIPSSFDGKILVPFAVESALSGVGKAVG